MNDALIPATGFVTAAALGWGFYVRGHHRVGNTMLAMSLAGLWTLAVIVHHEPSRVTPGIHRSPSSLHASELSDFGEPLTVTVSTLERATKVYHRSRCQYVRLMDRNAEGPSHKATLDLEAAIALGYQPCKTCFSTPERLARTPVPR